MATCVHLRNPYRHVLLVLSLTVGGDIALPLALRVTVGLHITLHSYLHLDSRPLGMNRLTLAKAVWGDSLAKHVLVYAHNVLLLAMSLAYASERNWAMAQALVFAAIAAPVWSVFFAAMVPVYAYAGFPWCTPKPQSVTKPGRSSTPRDAFPNLYFE